MCLNTYFVQRNEREAILMKHLFYKDLFILYPSIFTAQGGKGYKHCFTDKHIEFQSSHMSKTAQLIITDPESEAFSGYQFPVLFQDTTITYCSKALHTKTNKQIK